MLTPEQIKQMRAEVGIPEEGIGNLQVSAEDRITKLRTGAQKIYQESSPYNTGGALTSPILPYQKGASGGEAVAKSVVNLPTSVLRGGKEIGSAVLNIFNPDFIYKQFTQGNDEGSKNTLVNVAKLGSGLLQKTLSKITGKDINTDDTATAEAVGNFLQERYGSWENIKRTLQEDPAGLAFDVATALEGGGALVAKAGAKTAGAAIKVAGETINPVRVGAKVGGEATAVAGRAIKGTGEAVFKSSITPNVAEAERILKYDAKTPFLKRTTDYLKGNVDFKKPTLRSDTALEKGLIGRQKDIGVQASREADKLWSAKIEPAIKSSDAIVTKDDLFRPVLEKIEKTAEPGRKLALQEAFDAIQEEYKSIDSLSLEQAQAIKRGLDEFTPDKMFRGQNIANEYRTLKHEMANAIRQKTYESLEDVNIRKDYLDYGNLSELERIGVKAISEAGTKGGFGGFWTTMWDAATTPIKTVGGQVLYRVGNKLEFVGAKGIKKFGDFLKIKGFEQPN